MPATINTSKQDAYRHDLKGYIIGVVLATKLTVIAFAAVLTGMPRSSALWLIGVLGVVQIIVHVRYFLHVDLSKDKREELHLLLFSSFLLFIMAAGTLWVLFNMNERMMPGVMQM
jgi:cytochrome o ubiquinol oxidase operon protein cyoD